MLVWGMSCPCISAHSWFLPQMMWTKEACHWPFAGSSIPVVCWEWCLTTSRQISPRNFHEVGNKSCWKIANHWNYIMRYIMDWWHKMVAWSFKATYQEVTDRGLSVSDFLAYCFGYLLTMNSMFLKIHVKFHYMSKLMNIKTYQFFNV